MIQARRQRLARLEKMYIERVRQFNDLADAVLAEQALAHAVNLSVLIVYGDPKIDEPLSSAWQRCGNNPANPDGLLALARPPFNKAAAETAVIFRELLIPSLPGADEKEKLDAVFASAPPWLIWFTFGDFTADTLGLRLPDLSSVTRFARPQAIFDRWPALPSGKNADLGQTGPTTSRLLRKIGSCYAKRRDSRTIKCLPARGCGRLHPGRKLLGLSARSNGHPTPPPRK